MATVRRMGTAAVLRTRVVALVALMEVEVEASTRARNVLTLEVVGSTALSSCSLAS